MRCTLVMLALLLPLAYLGAAEVKLERTAGEVKLDLGNGVALDFAVHEGFLLGLRTASADGHALKSDQTVVRPYLVQEWVEKPLFFEFLRLQDAVTDGKRAELKLELLATSDEDAFRSFFIFSDENAKPHLDLFRFAHTQLPSMICSLAAQKARITRAAAAARPAGTLTWVIEPVTLNVAGWSWKGWRHHYEFELAGGLKLNCLRELGTWETDGQAVGNTLVSFRYRGLGGIAAHLDPLGGAAGASPAGGAAGVSPAGGAAGASPAGVPVKNVFTTTEILPNLMGQPPAVSPVVPGPQNIATRTEAMQYRHGAWIAQPQRGGGADWVDFQYRPAFGLAAWYEKMEAIRSLTEVWPGDAQVSHYDGLYFPLTSKAVTVPKLFVTLTPPDALPEHEWHTRWQEMQQFAREWIAKDLQFVPQDPLPSVGINWDSAWEFRLRGLIGQIPTLQEAGVKRLLVHHPGWFNGRGLRQKESDFPIPLDAAGKPDTGGDCVIHDYVPQSAKVRALWMEATRKLNAAGIQYWVWITGMVKDNGPVVKQFGSERFCRNRPGDTTSCGYPPKLFGVSLRDAGIRKWWDERMDAARDELGVQGFWADSWQNMYMSQMNYQHPDWAPQVREWWEWVGAASRKGVGFMAESTSFPALSCSIEVGDTPHDFEGVWWVLPYSTRWYRGEDVPHKKTAEADRLFFRSMANKGPIAPGDGDFSQVPGYRRLSDQYLAALPAMRRPYQLADQRGVLWLNNLSDSDAVLFAFEPAELPKGVTAIGLLEETNAERFAAHETYRLNGADLLAAFGLRRGPEKDPRLGQPYTPPAGYQKKWE